MNAFRIALKEYGATRRDVFSGQSGFAVDGRWHSQGRYLDYAATSRSLATLERLVHYRRFDALKPHVICALDVPDAAITRVSTIPSDWNGPDLLPAAQTIGNAWYDHQSSPALLVPSIVTDGEHNLLINARHPNWRWSWVVAGPDAFVFDPRLRELLACRAK